MDTNPAFAVDQRAVAKLRRAESLPRMEHSRWLPMHFAAMGDRENFQTEDERDVLEFTCGHDPPSEQNQTSPESFTSDRKHRRRSRSRAHSRNSNSRKLPQSAVSQSSSDSFPDHSSSPPFHTLCRCLYLLLHRYPPTSPLPLDILRLNRVAACMQTVQDSIFPSPSITPQPDFCNNTVPSSERSIARINLLTALGERRIRELDAGSTSWGEQRPVVSTPSKQRRRGSAQNSASKSYQAMFTDEPEVLSIRSPTVRRLHNNYSRDPLSFHNSYSRSPCIHS